MKTNPRNQHPTSLLLPVIVALLLGARPTTADDDPPAKALEAYRAAHPLSSPVKLPDAQVHLDVPYLGPWRDKAYATRPEPKAGTGSGLEYRTRCDIFVPPGQGPFPAVVMLHGGSYQGGSKRSPGWMSGRGNDFRNEGLRRGYVVISANYILGHGIHPQVQRDIRELVRFLRANAAKYHIDPHRIGMIGSSAGGWLTGASALTTADDGWVFTDGWRYRTAPLDGAGLKPTDLYLLLGDSPNPLYPEFSARLSAVVADFFDGDAAGSPDDPHVFRVVNPGGTGADAARQENGLLVTRVVLSKQGQHLPDNDQKVASATGTGQVTLFERVLQFLDTHLKGNEARTGAPEVRPNQRWFRDKIEVRLVGTGPGAVIHYTRDGTEPDTRSPRYDKPFTITDTTTIKAMAVAPGLKPSGVVTARFFQGPEPLAITGPAGDVLPPARVGQPYRVTFTAPGAARWRILTMAPDNEDAPVEKYTSSPQQTQYLAKVGVGVYLGLTTTASGETCELAGTPNRAGWVTVLATAAGAPGAGCPVAGERLYLLRIDPATAGAKE